MLVPQVSADWKAPQFVWQVRRELGRDALPRHARPTAPRSTPAATRSSRRSTGTCRRPPRSGSTSRPARPNAKDPSAILASRKIPGRRGPGSSACAATTSTTPRPRSIDYRTGEVLAYVGSASYTSKGNKKFQPQFDVLSDGWRQPGSAIKPIDYLIGIDDKTLTASTMFMDVTTNFGGGFIPTQADKLERGPVRLR